MWKNIYLVIIIRSRIRRSFLGELQKSLHIINYKKNSHEFEIIQIPLVY